MELRPPQHRQRGSVQHSEVEEQSCVVPQDMLTSEENVPKFL